MKNTIISYIINYVQNYKEARQTATAWTSPIVGFADANDPLFAALKESGQQNHLMPEAVLQMLITQKGCCGRVGSLVTEARIEPSPKPEEEYCKYKYDRTCKVCIKRCPTGALRENSFDRHCCYALCLKNAEFHKHEGLADVCGKCMSIVPCSFQKPYE